MLKKNLIVFGTRPEAIKMAPLVQKFKEQEDFETRVCVTAQHREMLDQVLSFFELSPHYDLDLMKSGQSLHALTARIVEGMKPVLEDFKPDYVFVHGDTTTTMAVALAAFYSGAKVCHIEAGLRTFKKRNPFPEEMNRNIVSKIADYHFAPTDTAEENLLLENISKNTIAITGNTVIDALYYSVNKLKNDDYSDVEINRLKEQIDFSDRILLVTGHRRENHGQGFINICNALKQIAEENPDVQIVYPVHLNPKVQKPVFELLQSVENINLIDPLSYPAFVWLMEKSYLIITDSGGIQEEAPSLGKPVLVMRQTTERPEAVTAGTVILVGTNKEKIVGETNKLLNDSAHYEQMTKLHNPYGDGKACERIVESVRHLNLQ